MNEFGLGFGPISPELLDSLSAPFGDRARQRDLERLRDEFVSGDPLGVRAITGAFPWLRRPPPEAPPVPAYLQEVTWPPDLCTMERPPAHIEEEHRRMTAAVAELEALEEEARRREVEELREERDRAVAALALRAALNGGWCCIYSSPVPKCSTLHMLRGRCTEEVKLYETVRRRRLRAPRQEVKLSGHVVGHDGHARRRGRGHRTGLGGRGTGTTGERTKEAAAVRKLPRRLHGRPVHEGLLLWFRDCHLGKIGDGIVKHLNRVESVSRANCHGRGHAQSLHHTPHVVPDVSETDSMTVPIEALREGQTEPSDTANVVPHGEVVPLHVGRADTGHVGRPEHGALCACGARHAIEECPASRGLPAV